MKWREAQGNVELILGGRERTYMTCSSLLIQVEVRGQLGGKLEKVLQAGLNAEGVGWERG